MLSFQAGFNTSVVLLGTTLLGVAAGVIGALALLRKRSLTADALAHATLPGIGIAFILATWMGFEGRSMPVLLVGAAATGVLGLLVVQAMLRFTRLTEDAAIAAVLSVSFGAGVVLLSYIQGMQSGNQGGLKTFIYGQTAAMNPRDAMLMAGIAAASMVVAGLMLKEMALTAFNDAFARVTGLPVAWLDVGLLGLIVLVTVAGLQAVGLILVVAMLIIPAAAARFWTDRVGRLVLVSGVFGGVSGYLGAAMSALLPRSPAGAVIVLTAGAVFILSMTIAPRRGVVAEAARRGRLRLKVAEEHALRHVLRAEGPATMRARPGQGGALMLAWLRLRGLMDGRGGLTASGRARAERFVRNARLWERYLVTHADVAASHVDWSADLVEHVLSTEMVSQLEREVAIEDAAVGGSDR